LQVQPAYPVLISITSITYINGNAITITESCFENSLQSLKIACGRASVRVTVSVDAGLGLNLRLRLKFRLSLKFRLRLKLRLRIGLRIILTSRFRVQNEPVWG